LIENPRWLKPHRTLCEIVLKLFLSETNNPFNTNLYVLAEQITPLS
jgi:hypothetical protein